MAIDSYSTSYKVCNTPSILEVISKKGFRITGTDSIGKWSQTDGLIKLCTEDINPNSPAKPRTEPCSLYSFKGYAHFYKVYPDGFTQNADGRPDDYLSYSNMLGSDCNDTAFKKDTFEAEGQAKPYHFSWLPKSYEKSSTSPWTVSSSHPWITGAVDPTGTSFTVTVAPNFESENRKGYIKFPYDCASTNADATRSFAVYVEQLNNGGSGDQPNLGDIYSYPGFEVYLENDALDALPSTTSTSPYILTSQGTYRFIIGGGATSLLQGNITVNEMHNGDPGLDYETSVYEAHSDGAAGEIVVTVENTTVSGSVLGFSFSNGTSTKEFFVAYLSN